MLFSEISNVLSSLSSSSKSANAETCEEGFGFDRIYMGGIHDIWAYSIEFEVSYI